MLDKKQQQTLITVAVLIIILGVVSFWMRPNFIYNDSTDYSKVKNSQIDSAAYQKYLQTLNIDPRASQEVFQEIISQDDVKSQVEADLNIGQPINPPQVADSQIKISNQSGQQAVIKYLTDSVTLLDNFNSQARPYSQQLFTQNKDNDNELQKQLQTQMGKLENVSVPKETVPMQKALVSSFMAFEQLVSLSQNYSVSDQTQPWPDVYGKYAAINDRLSFYDSELNRLADKYQLVSLPITLHYAELPGTGKFSLIPKASALFGIGDVAITVGDIPRIVREAIQDGLTASFAQFFGSFLQQMILKIESNYRISNFLYYSDALVSGQYADDYLNKYVTDNLDRQIIKKMLPQFSCGKQDASLNQVFQLKAQQYLGFDPSTIDPKDPNFNSKMAKVGDFLSSPQGWQIYYQDLAMAAESQAEKSAEQELLSPGLKTPRDISSHAIDLSISSIVGAQQASLSGLMNLGIGTASSFISKFVAQLTQTLMTQFVFRGASGGPRSGTQIGVLKEQPTCLAAAQVQAIVPISTTQYVNPPPPPSESDLLKEQCIKYPAACNASSTVGSIRGP